MARVNVYLPDALAREARAAGLNISAITQEGVRNRLARDATDRWLDRLGGLPRAAVPHERVLEALDDARAELGG